jgi:hypothetical protein
LLPLPVVLILRPYTYVCIAMKTLDVGLIREISLVRGIEPFQAQFYAYSFRVIPRLAGRFPCRLRSKVTLGASSGQMLGYKTITLNGRHVIKRFDETGCFRWPNTWLQRLSRSIAVTLSHGLTKHRVLIPVAKYLAAKAITLAR